MKTVEFYGFDDAGEDSIVGSLTWNGNSWSSTGGDWVNRVLDRPVVIRSHLVHAKEDPEVFMEGLHNQYRSAYFRASKVKSLNE